jgi:hypothetical protein
MLTLRAAKWTSKLPRAAQHAAGMSRYPSNLRRGGGSTARNALACVCECDEPVRADENVPSRQNGILGEIPRDGLPRHLLLPFIITPDIKLKRDFIEEVGRVVLDLCRSNWGV